MGEVHLTAKKTTHKLTIKTLVKAILEKAAAGLTAGFCAIVLICGYITAAFGKTALRQVQGGAMEKSTSVKRPISLFFLRFGRELHIRHTPLKKSFFIFRYNF